jgi:hypothetical protein
MSRAFSHVFSKIELRFSESIMRKNVQQQSGRWAGQDARTTEGMDAIRNIKTMAGSPDADLIFDQRLAILRMVFVFPGSVLS